MRVSEFRAFCEDMLQNRNPFMAVGPQGIGKTQVPEDLVAEWGWDCAAICMPMIDPSFLMGYPYRENGHAGHAPFGVLARALEATKPMLVILDEIGGASETVMKAGLRFLQFGEVAGRKLPDCVRVIALSNDTTHGAGVTGIVEPAKSRFDTIVNVEPHIDDTVAYGLGRGWPSWLLAFLRNTPDALYDYKPVKSMQIGGADPRGWERVAKLDRQGLLDKPYANEMVNGRVGKGRGTQAMAFRALINELPDVDAVLLDPDNAPVPGNPSAKFLVSMALASRMTAGNFGQCVKYLNKLPAMFRAFSIRDAFRAEAQKRRDKSLPQGWVPLSSSRDFTAWAVSSDGKDVMAAAS